ncbi:hypothetical protein FCIRC_11041 [Fusarium circinatum]|uniref:Mid2 domain-containing protein n=1 Tax=Fusarium circinatum TaxID=48490 RepID=A0A8H5WL41_FUSCI|nr:hypothetical protein FCIRC_11041 [Fusarium circinatum]
MQFSFVLGVFYVLLQPAVAQEGVCWGVDGKQWTNNKQCPGSSACCGEGATCMPNRLCKNKGQGENEFVRGPCAVAPYDKKKCAAICLYEERNNRFPRVKRCEDGSYCCWEDDPGCCAGKRGVFLDSKGNIEDDATSSIVSLIETTSSTETTPTIIIAASTTTSSDPSPTSDDMEETNARTTDSSQGMKIGLGVGVPAAAIIAGLSVWLFLRKKTAKHQDQITATSHPPMYHYPQPGAPDLSQAHLYQQQYPQAYGHYPEVGDQRRSKSPVTVQELQG